MSQRRCLSIVCLCLGCLLLANASPMSGQHDTYLDAKKEVHLLWSYNETHIEVQMTVKTLGWFALGISPDGQMDKTDAFVAWVNDTTGEPVIQDGWIDSNATAHRTIFRKDAHQDWTLLGGVQTTSDTSIRAVRALVTCDNQMDRPFSKDTLRIIWAFHPLDPADPARLPHHKKRGQKSILLFSSSFLRSTSVADSSSIPTELVIKMDKVIIQNDTIALSQCRFLALPKLTQKTHIISTRPLLQSGNEASIKRMSVYLCKPLADRHLLATSVDCHAPVKAEMMVNVRQDCDALIAVWASGGGTFVYPDEAGLPLNMNNSQATVLLEVQYYNSLKNVVNDSSGIILITTQVLRRYDAGLLTTGLLQYDYPLTIPPNVDALTLQSHCMDFCTQATLPSTGINIFAVLPIEHRQGRRFTLRHIRNGKELTELASDKNPDPLYQEVQSVIPVTVVFPGDRLIVECQYSTLDKTIPTFGGYGRDDETCLAFLSYYPAINLTSCGSVINTKKFLEVTDYIPLGSSSQSAVLDDIYLQDVVNSSLLRAYYASKYSWNSENTNKLVKFYRDEDQLGLCLGNGAESSMKSVHPTPYIPLPVKPATCLGRPSLQIPPPITLTASVGAAVSQGAKEKTEKTIFKTITDPKVTTAKSGSGASAVTRSAGKNLKSFISLLLACLLCISFLWL